MLFRCLSLLALWSIDAHAVLDGAKAAKLDQNPNFAGCPAIGSGTSSSNLCKRLKKPEEYCSYYNSNSTLGATPEVKAAFKACRDFYQAAIEGVQLVCDYEGDSNAVLKAGSKSAANVTGAAAAQGAAASTFACGRKMYSYYSDKLSEQSQKLDATFRAGKSTLSAVAKKSGEVVKTEVSCDLNGSPGYPPGYMLAGLAAAGLADQKDTKNNVSIVMAKVGKMINDNVQQAKLYTGRLTQNQTGLSTITGGEAITPSGSEEAVNKGAETSEGGSDKSLGGGRMVNKVFRKVTAGAAKDTAIDSSIHAANGEDVIKFEELLMGSDGLVFRHAAKANAAALVISLAIDVTSGELRKGTVVNELAGYGVFVYGSMLGSPALGVALAAEIVLYVGEQIQERWSEYDKEVTREFQKFAQAHVQQFPQASSAQVAQAYAPEKKEFAYCSKCSLPEERYGCPGFVGAQHGYNPNYRASTQGTNSQPFQNPWLAKAYQQYRVRATASSQFNGIPDVPPTSKAP